MGYILYIPMSIFVCILMNSSLFFVQHPPDIWPNSNNLRQLCDGRNSTHKDRKRIKSWLFAVASKDSSLCISCLFSNHWCKKYTLIWQWGRRSMRWREGGMDVCCVEEWRSLYCYVQTKVSTATTCTISPLIKTQGWSASITPHSHAHTLIYTLAHS